MPNWNRIIALDLYDLGTWTVHCKRLHWQFLLNERNRV